MRDSDEAARLGDRVFTVPNALSLLRLFLVPVVVALLLARSDALAAAFFVLAALTDFLDGRLARMAGPTRLGRVLDPLADRLMLSSVALVLAVRGLLPVWAVAILVGRDLLALLGSLVVGSKIRVNRVGKAATAVLMGAVVLVVVSPGVVAQIVFYAGFGLSIVAGLMYARSLRRILRGEAR
jgi:cardiolipin synthase (CMP-forming)